MALERAFAGAERSGKKARNSLDAAGMGIQRAGATMSAVGSKLTRNVSLPLGLIGGTAIKTAVDFEKAMRNVNSIAGLPSKQFQKLGHEVTAMAGPLAQSPHTLAEGLYDLVSSGFDAKESMVVLHASAKAATAGLTTTEVSTKAVAAALNAYHRPAKEAGAISDDLFETVNRGVVSFEELAGSIGYVLPAAATLGITSKEIGAGISTLTKEGQSGETAVTNLNQALTAFIKPSKGMSKAVDELGYKNAETMLKTLHFQGSLEALFKVAHGSKEKLGEYFGNVRAMRAVFGLTGASAKTAQGDLKAFTNDTGSTAKVFKEQTHSVAFQFSQLKAEAEVLGISLGHKLFPLIRSIGKELGGAIKYFTELPAGVQKGIVQFGLFAIAAGPVIRVVGGLTSGIGGLLRVAGGLGEVGKGIGGFASMFSTALKSGQGIAGSFAIAGEAAAPALMTGLTKVLPVVAGAAGIGSIVVSATKGDWEQAGFKAGGALIGGIAGFFAGGGPLGAALGVGIGSLAGGLLGGLFTSAKKLHPMQERLAASARGMAEAFKAAHSAAQALGRGEDNVKDAHQRTQKATAAARKAQENLNDVRHKSGPDSQPVIRAERDLAKAKERVTEATHDEQRAERQHGAELKATKELERIAILEERHRIHVLHDQRDALLQQKHALEENGATIQQLRPVNERLTKNYEGSQQASKKLNTTLVEAAQIGGPKWAKFLEDATRKSLDLGRNVNETGHQIVQSLKGPIKQTGTLSDSFTKNFGTAKGDVRSWAGSTKARTGEVTSTLDSALAALGVNQVNFGTTKKQRGGGLGGTGTGDTIPAMLEPGEYVLNRKAVEHIGTRALDAINFSVAPRFQKGGATSPLGPEPRLSGTQPLRGAGQHGVHEVYTAAVNYYNAHDGKARVIANANRMDAMHQPYLWGGGHGATASVNGPWDCSGGISEMFDGAGWNFPPMVSGGFTTWGLPGKGDVSVLANAEHVYAVVAGKGAVGTSDSKPGGGFGWIDEYTFRPGFTIRHADFSDQAMKPTSAGRRGKGQNQKKGFQKGGVVSGKVSFFGGGEEASGMDTSQPGIAVNLKPGTETGWQNPTTEGWMTAAREGHPVYASVTIAGKSANLPITDLGPAGFTQRAIDVTEGGVRKLGFTTSNFPTDAIGKAVIGGSTASDKTKKPSKRSVIEGSKHFAKGRTSAGGTSAGFATHKEIDVARATGIAHAKNPTLSHGVAQSKLPSWARGLPLYQREELEGRATTLPERETILGNAETNATFEEGIAERALAKAKKAYAQNPNATTWAVVAAKSSRVREKRKAQAAATKARKLFEKGYIDHLTKGIKKINSQLESGAGKLSFKQVAALRAKRAELVSLRASARGEAQSAIEAQEGYEEAGEAEAAEIEEESPLNKIVEGFNEVAEGIGAGGESGSGGGSSAAEEAKQAEEEHTVALKELTEALNSQTELGKSILATSSGVFVRAIADMQDGQLGARTQMAATTAGNGTIGRS